MFACSSKTRIFLISFRGWHQSGWKEADCGSHLEETDDNVANPHHFLTLYTWEVTQRECKPNEIIFEEHTKMFESRISDGPTEKLQVTVAWFYDMEGHARKCVERYCELANNVEQLYSVSSPCVRDHQFKSEELESDGELSPACSQNVVKCLYLARIGRPDILWSVDKLARAVTKWTQACDRRLARLISYIHHTHMTTDNIVLWLSIVAWSYSKTQILLETWRTQTQPQEESYVSLEAHQLNVQETDVSIP